MLNNIIETIKDFFKKEQLFICYRRSESFGIADEVYNQIHKEGKYEIFKDTKVLRAGDEWADMIEDKVRNCSKMLLFIGKGWEKRFEYDLVKTELSDLKESLEIQMQANNPTQSNQDSVYIVLEILKNSQYAEQFNKNRTFSFAYDKLEEAINAKDDKSTGINLMELLETSIDILSENEEHDYVRFEIESFIEKRDNIEKTLNNEYDSKLNRIDQKIKEANSPFRLKYLTTRRQNIEDKVTRLKNKAATLIPIFAFRGEELNKDKLPEKLKKLPEFNNIKFDYINFKERYNDLSNILYSGIFSKAYWTKLGTFIDSYKTFASLFFIPLLLFLGYSLFDLYQTKNLNNKLADNKSETTKITETVSTINERFMDNDNPNYTGTLTKIQNTLFTIQDSLKQKENYNNIISKIDNYYEKNPEKFLTANELDSLLSLHFIDVDDRINNVNLALRKIIMQILNDCKPMAKEYIDCSLINCDHNSHE